MKRYIVLVNTGENNLYMRDTGQKYGYFDTTTDKNKVRLFKRKSDATQSINYWKHNIRMISPKFTIKEIDIDWN